MSQLSTAFSAETFLNLFVTQLKHQDPLEPMDANKITEQLAQLATVESLSSLDNRFENMLHLEQMNTAKDLIGFSVSYLDEDGAKASGVVDDVRLQGGDVGVQLGQRFLRLEDIIGINRL